MIFNGKALRKQFAVPEKRYLVLWDESAYTPDQIDTNNCQNRVFAESGRSVSLMFEDIRFETGCENFLVVMPSGYVLKHYGVVDND